MHRVGSRTIKTFVNQAEKFGLSDATPAEQANHNKIARSKARSKDDPVPDRSIFATRAALDSKRISCEVTLHFGDGQLGSTDVQQDTDVKMRIPWKVETTFWRALPSLRANRKAGVKLNDQQGNEKKKQARLESQMRA